MKQENLVDKGQTSTQMVYNDMNSLSIEAFSKLTSKNFEMNLQVKLQILFVNSAKKKKNKQKQKTKQKAIQLCFALSNKEIRLRSYLCRYPGKKQHFVLWQKDLKKKKVDIMKSFQMKLSNDNIQCTNYVQDSSRLHTCWL